MGAIPQRHYNWLEQITVGVMKPRLANLTPALTLTHDEFLHLYVKPEDHDIVRQASKIVGSSGGYHIGTLKRADLEERIGTGIKQIQFQCYVADVDGRCILTPHNTKVLATAPEDLVERLVAWAAIQVRNNLEVNRVVRLLSWLNDNCANTSQVRYLWPSILAICAMDPYQNQELAAFANRIRELKRPQTLPYIPPEVLAAFKSTASIVAALSLLPPDSAAPVAVPPVSVQLYGNPAARQEGALGWISGA